ncbi:MAG: ATP-dependent DNA helicase RecG [Patescibacteria group bacterium]
MQQLSDSIETLNFVGPSYAKKLEKLGITSINHLLHHIPFRFIDFRKTANISSLQIDEIVTIKGEVTEAKNQYTRNGKKLQLFTLADKTGKIEVVWFNQPFILNSIKVGYNISVAGQVVWFGRKKVIISPEYEINTQGVHTGRLLPIYHETAGISSKWLRRRIAEVLESQIDLSEFLPEEILQREKLIGFRQAIMNVHFPQSEQAFELGKKRLAFNELLLMHLATMHRKKDWENLQASYTLKLSKKILKEFFSLLSFKLTTSQDTAIGQIIDDLAKPTPMNRLLEGDVGSGKTVVAAAAAFVSFANGYQTIIMAPTQILAQQHYNTIKDLFEPLDLTVTLITSQSKGNSLTKSDIFIGTHALIHQKLNFDNVSLVVIDEQHRFGVEQRNHLVKKVGGKTKVPHVLTMTATPIPRTVAMSFYGDLDLSVLKELPKERQKITTWLVPPEKRDGAYAWIGEQINKEQIQAYVVCPLIEESDAETLQSVRGAKAEYEKLQNLYKDLRVGLLHGKQTIKQKNAVLDKFKAHEIDILVTTPVVEVGIDVANAAIMMIEAADRFGLAQLHQLRGRVGRGSKKSYCLVMTESDTQKTLDRLAALKKTMSGFELAELDLAMRGPGEIFGTRQSGFPELKIATWQDTDLIIRSRNVAGDLLKLGSHDTITKKETHKS